MDDKLAARSRSTSKTRCASPTWTTRCRVIIGRALPDARDGLKPVHRRILYAMFSEGLLHNRRYSKCAGVVGEVLKRYHPHGDSAVYDALVRLAQDWNVRYPLIDGQGNFGSVDGDPAGGLSLHRVPPDASSPRSCSPTSTRRRSTSSRTSTIPRRSRSSSRRKVPNLLVNGSSGIAVGMATNIPPHNLGEVCDGADRADREPRPDRRRPDAVHPGPGLSRPPGSSAGRRPIREAYRDGPRHPHAARPGRGRDRRARAAGRRSSSPRSRIR